MRQRQRSEEYERLVEGAPILRRAYDELERCSWSEEELNTYEQIKKRTLDNAAALHCKLQEGMALGEEKGIAIGKEEGMATGEETTKKSLARQMLSKGTDIALISELIGMSAEAIGQL